MPAFFLFTYVGILYKTFCDHFSHEIIYYLCMLLCVRTRVSLALNNALLLSENRGMTHSENEFSQFRQLSVNVTYEAQFDIQTYSESAFERET